MNNLSVTSNIIFYYFLSAFIVLIISIIIFKIIKERGEKIKIQSDSHVKKESELSSNNEVNTIREESVKDYHRRAIYSIYQKDALTNKAESNEFKSQSINKKVITKYQRYLGLGYNKGDKEIEKGNSIWG